MVRDGSTYPAVDMAAVLSTTLRNQDTMPLYSTERGTETLLSIGKKLAIAPSRLLALNSEE